MLTARGNPYGNVVRDGDEVVIHTAAGKDLRIKPLKLLKQQNLLSEEGRVAMAGVKGHLQRMECYACHSSWTPQCYGCHVKIDYSRKDECPECEEDNVNIDWLKAGRQHQLPEYAADRGESKYDTLIPGKVTEQRSYLRWEDPILGVNGEGRITPLAPGCQPSVTIIGADGEPILLNHIFETPTGTEGGGNHGQLAIDMSPVQPHTTTKDARSCDSCHSSEKALGYGIGGGKHTRSPDERVVVDLETVDGDILSNRAVTQLEPIENLPDDWSRIVSEDGKQLMTVGHHFKLSRPLNNDERARMNRHGTCLACHREIPDDSLAVNLLHHVAKYTGQVPKTAEQHSALIHKITLLAAWTQVLAMIVTPVLVVAVAVLIRRRRRRRGGTSVRGSHAGFGEPSDEAAETGVAAPRKDAA